MKFTKPFYGVPNGEIYPVEYRPGDTCPPELEHAAKEAESIDGSVVGVSADEQSGDAVSIPVVAHTDPIVEQREIVDLTVKHPNVSAEPGAAPQPTASAVRKPKK